MRKVKRIKVNELVTAGVMKVLPGNPKRPEVGLDWDEDGNGVVVENFKTNEKLLVPWWNLIEVVFEDVFEEVVEEPKKKGRRARAQEE